MNATQKKHLLKFPKHLNILATSLLVRNSSSISGEVFEAEGTDKEFLGVFSKALGFTYKMFDSRYLANVTVELDFFLGNINLDEGSYFDEWAIYPHGATDITFVIQKPGFVKETFAFLKPFSWDMWLSILFSVIFASAAHYLMFRREISLSSACFYIFGTMFGKYHNWHPKSLAEKTLILTWTLGIMFISLSYGSVLLSFLTVPVREQGVKDINDLYRAVRRGAVKLAAYGDGNLRAVINPQESNEKLYFILKQLEKGNILPTKEDILKEVKDNIVLIAERGVIDLLFDDRYVISEDSLYPIFFAMFDDTEEGFCCTEKVNEFVHRSWAAALYKKIVADTSFKRALKYKLLKENTIDEKSMRLLTLSNFAGTFYFLITGHVIGLVCLICEIRVSRVSA